MLNHDHLYISITYSVLVTIINTKIEKMTKLHLHYIDSINCMNMKKLCMI